MSKQFGEYVATVPGRAHWFARTLVVVVGLGLWFFTQSLIGSRPFDPADAAAGAPISRGDTLFQLTAPINDYLHQNPHVADALLIASSAAIDVMGLWLIASSIFGPTMRPFIGLLLLFALRQVTQALCVLPTPDGMIWRDPGVPSLLVTYHVANDFFFSGHTAIAVFAASQLARRKQPLLLALGIALALFEIGTVIVLRAHYTMDVIAGAVAAVWAAHAADYIAPRLDRTLAAWWPATTPNAA
jgi:membrane-associated phospholipid phosphatase